MDVDTGLRQQLADLEPHANNRPASGAAPQTGRFRFRPVGLAAGAAALAAGARCDLLFVDELGPLELLQSGGWSGPARIALQTETFRLALVVVRPALLDRFQAWLNVPDETWPVTAENRDLLPIRLVARLEPAT